MENRSPKKELEILISRYRVAQAIYKAAKESLEPGGSQSVIFGGARSTSKRREELKHREAGLEKIAQEIVKNAQYWGLLDSLPEDLRDI